jgi:hypothetical protein
MFKKVLIGVAAFVLLACLGIALLGGLGVYAFLHKDDGVLNPARRVQEAAVTLDLLKHPSNYQDDFTPDAYAALLRLIAEKPMPAPAGVVHCTYPGNVRYLGSDALAQLSLVVRDQSGKLLLFVENFHLVRQNGQWRLSDLGQAVSVGDVSGSPVLANCQGAALYVYPPTPTPENGK